MTRILRHIIWTLCLLTTLKACSSSSNNNSNQTNSDTSTIAASPTEPANLILDTLAVAHGDLNSDKISDLVVVFKRPGEDTIFNIPPTRPLKVYFGLAKGDYSLNGSSDSIVMTHDMGGASNPDPFDNILIDNGVLIVNHHGGMGSYHWGVSTSFKYSVADKIFYVSKIERQDGKFSDNPSEAFEKESIKTEKDLGKLTFGKYSVFNIQE